MAKKVEFVTADDSTRSPFLLHIKAAVAEEERRLISERTKAALQAAKERGVVLGNQKLADANKAAAAARDAADLGSDGDRTYREIAQELTDRGIKTPRGGDAWNQVTVRRTLKRLGLAAW
jgi:DNA invertase Pin-like site-specific DNA recombinase